MTGTAGERAARSITWIIQACGGIAFAVAAPPFYHALMGVRVGRTAQVLFVVVDAAVVVSALVNLAIPRQPVATTIMLVTLFGLIAYGLVFVAVRLRTVGDPILRRALGVFLALSLSFFPLMLVDSLMAVVPALSIFGFLEGLAQPVYFLILNVLSIAFGLRYLDRPAYAEGDRLTEHFLSTYGITVREAEIIGHLLRGATARAVADALFISPKTAENHLYSIYQKLGVRNRVQLYQLIRANGVE